MEVRRDPSPGGGWETGDRSEAGGVWRRLRLGTGDSEPCRLRNGFGLFGKGWKEGV